MKKLLFLFPVLLLFACSGDDSFNNATENTAVANKQAQNGFHNMDSKALFNMDVVPTITLQFSIQQWNKILTNYDLNPKNEIKVVAGFTYTVNGSTVHLDSIGLKLK